MVTQDIMTPFAQSKLSAPHPPARQGMLADLRAFEQNHPYWKCRLLAGFRLGSLSREDIRYFFSQYYFYSRNFTRLLAALMANCENDLFRSRLSENLWEEGGGAEPERRHAELFRTFLRDALGVSDPDAVHAEAYTQHFVREYLVFCLRSEPAVGSAFLSLGTEGIVSRTYATMVEGMLKAGFERNALEFFHVHIECDDEHSKTLEDIMLSYTGQPAWFENCVRALDHALSLRAEFFDNVYEAILRRRVDAMLVSIRGRKSLAWQPSKAKHRPLEAAGGLYSNKIDRLNLEFYVDRLPFDGEVLDPRMVRIPIGKCNENHRHAHETFMYFVEGKGTVSLDGTVLEVAAGDSVLVPRWALHQTKNEGPSDLRFVAVTDFNLTERAAPADADGYRMIGV